MGVIEFASAAQRTAESASETAAHAQRRQAAATGHHPHSIGMAMVLRYLLRNKDRLKAERTYGVAMATARASLAKMG